MTLSVFLGVSDLQMTLLVIVLFVVFFPLLWCMVLLILSFAGGWRSLAERFRTYDSPTGVPFHSQRGRMGWVNYNGCLTVWKSAEGLHISVWPLFRVWHPALFIPWSEIHGLRKKSFLWVKNVAFDVGAPRIATVELNEKIFDGMLPAER